ncbi:ead/Ea22-like family protein [Citrobacter freundii]|nr:ead/Ea22-like family protein [Citrobacter freundii]
MTAINKQALREELEICSKDRLRKMVMSLLDENLQLQRDKDSLEAAALAMRDDMREAREKLEAAEKQLTSWRSLAKLNIEEHEKAVSALDATRQRICELESKLTQSESWSLAAQKYIAELEARAVNLPKRSVGGVMHMSGFSRDYAEGWCAGNDNAIHKIRAAGIGVKGE